MNFTIYSIPEITSVVGIFITWITAFNRTIKRLGSGATHDKHTFKADVHFHVERRVSSSLLQDPAVQ